MEHIHQGYRGLSLLMRLNSDRILFVGALAMALALAAYLVSSVV